MNKLQQTVYILLIISLSIGLLYISREFLVPLCLALVLAMLFVRLANRMESNGISRSFSALISVLLFVSAVGVILSLLTWRLTDFAENIEEMKAQTLTMFEKMKSWVDKTLGIPPKEQDELIKQNGTSGESGSGNVLTTFAGGTMSFLVDAVLVLVYMFLFLYSRSHLKRFIIKLVPTDQQGKAKKIIQESAHVSQLYLGGLAAMIVMLWILYSIGFSLVGVENAIFFAILCGLLEIVPFVGNVTGTSLTVLAVVAQGGGGDMILGVLAVYMLIQFVQTYLLEPLVVGNEVNINPLFTIIVLVVGELVWGIGGMILAIPLLGMAKIVFDNIPALRPLGFLIGTEKKTRKNIFEKLKNKLTKLSN